MQKQLIKLAREKGFKSKHIDLDFFTVKDGNLYEYWLYLWLCELQKWLRDEHNINFWVECFYHDGLNYFCESEIKILDFFKSIDEYDEWFANNFIGNFNSYEKALEEGSKQALKLIKA